MAVLTYVIDHRSDLGDKGTNFTGMHLGSLLKVSAYKTLYSNEKITMKQKLDVYYCRACISSPLATVGKKERLVYPC